MASEAELRRRGWSAATSPADADILLLCGEPGRELEAICARVWNQLPGPRSRAVVREPSDVGPALDDAARALGDDDAQRRDERSRSRRIDEQHPMADMEHIDHSDMDHMDHSDMDHAGMDQSDTDNAVMDDAGTDHKGMDHSHMDMDMDMHDHMSMSGPAGIPLASGAPDRDGLEMDVLHVPLGPVLPHWPAGLVVDCVLHGDVIGSAEARVLPAAHPRSVSPSDDSHTARLRRLVVRNCDQASRVLALAGWTSASTRAQRMRDDARAGITLAELTAPLQSLAGTVARSRVLRWSIRRITVASGAPDGTDPITVRDRLLGLLHDAANACGGAAGAGATDDPASAQERLRALPALIKGRDIATARMIIAGSGIDTAELAATESPVS